MGQFEEIGLDRRTTGRAARKGKGFRHYTRKGGYHEFQLAMLKHMDNPEANPEFDPDWYTD